MYKRSLAQNRKLRILIMLTALVMLFIFIQSALPADLSSKESNVIVLAIAGFLNADVDTVSFVVRKCAHCAEFLVLGIFLFLTVREWLLRDTGNLEKLSKNGFLTAWGIGAAYAVTDEIHQMFVPGRSCELRDILLDAAGVLIGAGLIRVSGTIKKS